MAVVDSAEAVITADPWTWPRGAQLGWHNRRIMAVRMAWPAGALEACEAIEQANPAWSPWWRAANTIEGWEAPAGFYARPGDMEPYAYGADAEALALAIAARTSRCQTCGTIVPAPAASETPSHRADDGDRCYARQYQITMDTSWSHCPRCMTWWDLPRGSEVPPHQVADEGWCPVRCSQQTV